MNRQSLIFIPQVKPNARFRLVCFPYAGGSALTYNQWAKKLHSNVELALIQLPGRSSRFSEKPYETMSDLVKDIFISLNGLTKKKLVFFGHSMGARVAYELTLLLKLHTYNLPISIIVSGSVAPGVKRTKEPSFMLPDEEFISHLRELNGTPEEILKNDEIMHLLLPAIRADFKIFETYHNRSIGAVSTQISIFSGKKDNLELSDLEAWLPLFTSNTGIHWFDGGHFFVEENRDEVIDKVNEILGKLQPI